MSGICPTLLPLPSNTQSQCQDNHGRRKFYPRSFRVSPSLCGISKPGKGDYDQLSTCLLSACIPLHQVPLLINHRYLIDGNLSDLTLIFGEKSWQIHKALACCHSKWFQKAVTSGFEVCGSSRRSKLQVTSSCRSRRAESSL